MPELMKVEINGVEVEREVIGYEEKDYSLINDRKGKMKALPFPQPYVARDEMVYWRLGSTVPMIVKIKEDQEL